MLPAWMMPEPAPLDSVAHYPPLGMVQVGEVSVPLRDGRAVKPKANEDAKIKIRTVPARPRSVAAAPRRPDPKRAPSQRSATVPEEMEVGVISDVETPVKKSEKQECTVEEMFPYLPVQPPRQLSIAEGIIADRQVDVVMDEAEPNWADEIARLDRQWEIRFKALDDQWNHRLSNLTRDWDTRFSRFDRQWVEPAGSLQQQLSTLRQTVETKVKAHFGEALQAQLEVAAATHEEGISNLRCDLMEYINAAVFRTRREQWVPMPNTWKVSLRPT